jgi:hypothetical protein
MIDYDGRQFSPATDTPGPRPVAHYHQAGDLVWGEFSGGHVRRGTLAGTSDPEGEVRFAYCMVLGDGTIVTGICHSVPQVLADGRVRFTEHWQRFTPEASSGTSFLEELPHAASVH